MSAVPRWRGSLAAVLAAAAIAHLPVLGNGFVWDDVVFIAGNPVVKDLGNAAALFARPETWGTAVQNPYYRPLTTLTFMADWHLWGGRPAGFHATNLLLHLGACVLLLAVLRRLFAPGPALVAALLFAVHPAHAEPVAYVSARADLLCAVFLLASFLAWIRRAAGGGRAALALSAAAYGAALLTKIAAGPFPAVFALHGLLLARRRPRELARDLLPFAAVAAAYLAVRAAVLDVTSWGSEPLVVRAATAGPIIVRYLLMSVFPPALSVFHDLSPRPGFDPRSVAAWVAITAAVVVAATAARRHPRLVVGFAWFLAGVVPVSGLVTLLYPALAADRYLYLPLLGGSLAAGALLERPAVAVRFAAAAGRAAVPLLVTALVAVAAATAARGRLWRDSTALWERAAVEAPGRPYVLNALSWAYRTTDRYEEAERAIRTSLAIDDTNAESHLALAVFSLLRDDLETAERHTVRALDLAPGAAIAYRYLGVTFALKGNFPVALRAAERALALDPDDAETAKLVAFLRDEAHPGAVAD